MGLFQSMGSALGMGNQAASVGAITGAGSYGNGLGLRPELEQIGDNYRDLRSYVEGQVKTIMNLPEELTSSEIDVMASADAEEAAQHELRQKYMQFGQSRLERAYSQFGTQLEVANAQERQAHGTQQQLIRHVDLKASNAVEASMQEHILAGRLAAFSKRNAGVQNLVSIAGG